MTRDPIATLDDGGFVVFGDALTHHEALRYAYDPDADGVVRDEPSDRTLLLRYTAGKVVRVYLRGQGARDALGSPLALTVRLYDGTTLLAKTVLTVHAQPATYTWATGVQTALADPRVAVLTSKMQPQERGTDYAYLTLTMLVVEDDDDAPPPPVRVTRLMHARDYLSPRWVMQVETNDPAPIDPPAGFRIVSAAPPLRIVAGQAYPPDSILRTYELELSEV